MPADPLDGLPPALLDMQRRAEATYIALKTAERSAIALRGHRPQPFRRPARPGLVQRAAMRLLPPLARAWHVRILAESGLLDAGWYFAAYPDVAAAGADAAKHYLLWGAAEGRDPGPRFSTAHYLKLYPDVKASGVNPLVHYLTAGWEEKRSIHALMPEGQA